MKTLLLISILLTACTQKTATYTTTDCQPDGIWSQKMDACIEVFPCATDTDCGDYSECIGSTPAGERVCLPV